MLNFYFIFTFKITSIISKANLKNFSCEVTNVISKFEFLISYGYSSLFSLSTSFNNLLNIFSISKFSNELVSIKGHLNSSESFFIFSSDISLKKIYLIKSLIIFKSYIILFTNIVNLPSRI